MTQDEALKLALEALEGVLDNSPKVLEASISGGLYEVVQCRDAITAIKEALAQPVDDIASIIACRDALDAQPVPEISPESLYNIMEAMGFAPHPWVGLTDDEVYKIAFALEGEHWKKVADAIEAKLKEKNG
jgi:hypothetical protein